MRQYARQWNKNIHSKLIEDGFIQSENDQCLYSKTVDGKWIYVLVYVDDIIIASDSDELIISVARQLCKTFDMCDLGELMFYLGIHIE